jgi:hypothetical protein
MSERDVTEWMKMPMPLQHQFFQHAEEEAERCKKRFGERGQRLQELNRHIKVENIPQNDD